MSFNKKQYTIFVSSKSRFNRSAKQCSILIPEFDMKLAQGSSECYVQCTQWNYGLIASADCIKSIHLRSNFFTGTNTVDTSAGGASSPSYGNTLAMIPRPAYTAATDQPYFITEVENASCAKVTTSPFG